MCKASMKLMVLGDVHGDWPALNKLLNIKKPDWVIQCGDFGYWPGVRAVEQSHHGYYPDDPRPYKVWKSKATGPKTPAGCKLLWCDGNHEDHWELRRQVAKCNGAAFEPWPNVQYMPRGSIWHAPDGRKVMFVGGADSIDKDCRRLGIDWFPEEVVSMADYAAFVHAQKVDIVISHTCPWEFEMKDGLHDNDCSRTALSRVLENYSPDLWYFGHWHDTAHGMYKNCRWQAMNRNGQTGWWQWLPEK